MRSLRSRSSIFQWFLHYLAAIQRELPLRLVKYESNPGTKRKFCLSLNLEHSSCPEGTSHTSPGLHPGLVCGAPLGRWWKCLLFWHEMCAECAKSSGATTRVAPTNRNRPLGNFRSRLGEDHAGWRPAHPGGTWGNHKGCPYNSHRPC